MSLPFASLLERDWRPRILLVGDIMLDRYLWGDVERISPEAPIPVLRVGKQEHRLGGAGSVAAMLATLGAQTILAAAVGDDAEGRVVRELLDKLEISDRQVLTLPDRCTTVKERLLGRAQQRHPHQMMRVDREADGPIPAAATEGLLAAMARCMDEIDLVLVSDYNKGVCKGEMIPRLVKLARAAGVPVIADPVRDADYHRYAGCACVTPNRTEAGLAVGRRITTPQEGLEAAQRLLDFGVESALVTLDHDGMAWAGAAGGARLFPVRPRQVCDVTGAGDMVLATLGYMIAAGADYPSAIEIANTAGGLEVERQGVVPLSRQEILAELAHSMPAAASQQKIVSVEQVEGELWRRRQAGQRIVMTNGCFDLLHPGHVASLQEARKQGDCLVVGLNSDRSVRELKGAGHPLVDQQGRAEMLAALSCVDHVVIFDDASVAGLVERLSPDVLVKAAQYSLEQVVGYQIVARYGGRVVAVPMKPAYSTTALIEKIRNLPQRTRTAA
jgi:D-beta-D-heptose 7-phosphate kinase/D-beta-D-heptose 1-phosphate adenosyltransferase